MSLCDTMAAPHKRAIVEVPDMHSLSRRTNNHRESNLTENIKSHGGSECTHTWLATLSRARLPVEDTVKDMIGWSSSILEGERRSDCHTHICMYKHLVLTESDMTCPESCIF